MILANKWLADNPITLLLIPPLIFLVRVLSSTDANDALNVGELYTNPNPKKDEGSEEIFNVLVSK